MENNRKKKIRIKDIAEHAGVSIGTVDRVLHNRGEVNEETKKRILDIVNKLGYKPNILAKSLASKRHHRIATLIPDASDNNPYWEKPRLGIIQAASEIKDFNTEVEFYTFNATDVTTFVEKSRQILDSKPDGVVFDPVFKEASIDFVEVLDALSIPYIYIDVDLEKGNTLSYFGQDAEKSGFVAAKLMHYNIKEDATILVVKLANKKAISRHLIRRENGFNEFFQQSNISNSVAIVSIVIDLAQEDEPSTTLTQKLQEYKNVKGIFVPNSRVFKVARFLEESQNQKILLLGYDLVDSNIYYLEKGIIDFLIGQKPEEQGYKGVMAMFNKLVGLKHPEKENNSPIDIIMKENIEYYKRFI